MKTDFSYFILCAKWNYHCETSAFSNPVAPVQVKGLSAQSRHGS